MAEKDIRFYQLRLPAETHERLARLAERYGKSLHWVILRAIEVADPTLERESDQVHEVIGRRPVS